MEIKIIKLVNGDDIVCRIPSEQDTKSKWLSISKPMHIKYVPKLTLQGLTDYVALVKWTAYSPDERVSIPKDKIMTLTSAAATLKKSYDILEDSFHKQEIREEENPPVSENDIPEYSKRELTDDENKRLNEIFEELDFEDADGKLH